MNAELYIVPVGMVEEEIVTNIEIYISDLSMIVSPENSMLIEEEEAEKRYEDLAKVSDIELPDEDKQVYENLQLSLATKFDNEVAVLSKLEPLITEAIEKFQSQPQIHIPTACETSEVLGDSGIIFEG